MFGQDRILYIIVYFTLHDLTVYFTTQSQGIPGTEYPSNITRHISAMLVDSDECQKAKTVNTSTCNEAHFWCKEWIEGPVRLPVPYLGQNGSMSWSEIYYLIGPDFFRGLSRSTRFPTNQLRSVV